jgi:hypothetical protein
MICRLILGMKKTELQKSCEYETKMKAPKRKSEIEMGTAD